MPADKFLGLSRQDQRALDDYNGAIVEDAMNRALERIAVHMEDTINLKDGAQVMINESAKILKDYIEATKEQIKGLDMEQEELKVLHENGDPRATDRYAKNLRGNIKIKARLIGSMQRLISAHNSLIHNNSELPKLPGFGKGEIKIFGPTNVLNGDVKAPSLRGKTATERWEARKRQYEP